MKPKITQHEQVCCVPVCQGRKLSRQGDNTQIAGPWGGRGSAQLRQGWRPAPPSEPTHLRTWLASAPRWSHSGLWHIPYSHPPQGRALAPLTQAHLLSQMLASVRNNCVYFWSPENTLGNPVALIICSAVNQNTTISLLLKFIISQSNCTCPSWTQRRLWGTWNNFTAPDQSYHTRQVELCPPAPSKSVKRWKLLSLTTHYWFCSAISCGSKAKKL